MRGMSFRAHGWSAFGILIVLAAVPAGWAEKSYSHEQIVPLVAWWYLGISAEETGRPLTHTSKPLTWELDKDTRVVVPPHLAKQVVIEAKRMDLGPGLEEAAVVGLNAYAPNVPPQGYALIYSRKDSQMVLYAELPLRQHFERFERAQVSPEEPLLVIYGASGAHFTDLWVYRFFGGQPQLLFANGSAAGVEVRGSAPVLAPTIWIAVENWMDPNWNFASSDRRWNVYSWTGREFLYNEKLSSAREMSVEERLSQYTMRLFSNLEELKKNPTVREGLADLKNQEGLR